MVDPTLSTQVRALATGETTTVATLRAQWEQDAQQAGWTYAVQSPAVAWDRQCALLRAVLPWVEKFGAARLRSRDRALVALWRLWLPLALELSDRQQTMQRPFVQGILGGQGTGKTTLGRVLTHLLGHLGHRPLSLSLDDLYKPYAARQALQQTDPRLRWRGPPGTHDVALGRQTLERLRHAPPDTAIPIPRFDKALHQGAGDRVAPEIVHNIDIVLFEGWCVGLEPIDPAAFAAAPWPLETASDRAFARDMNQALRAYQPLWQQLDRLLVLQPVDYRLTQQWRRQAEQERRAQGQGGMSDAEVDAFVTYFWQALHPALFLPPLLAAGRADRVVEIQPDHSVGKIESLGAP